MRTINLMLAVYFLVMANSLVRPLPKENVIYDEDVNLVSAAAMEYPKIALMLPIRGTVVVKVTLNEAGEVVTASAISGLPSLVPACLSNARKWHFQPNPQRSAIIVYEFRLGDSACSGLAYSRIRRPNIVEVTLCPHVLETQSEKRSRKKPLNSSRDIQ